MSDDKIKQFSPRKVKRINFPVKNNFAEIKEYLGFGYVKLNKDVNGISLNEKALLDFARELRYTISIMRVIDEKVFLYEYFVQSSDLKKFLNAYINGTIEGEIIQIEKHNSDNLA